ncbi:hypothetical protein LXL04_007778 [Taraxacum kok-saghyz]
MAGILDSHSLGTIPIEYINLDSVLEDPIEEIQEFYNCTMNPLRVREDLETQVNFTEKLQQTYVIANGPWYTKVTDAFIYGQLKVLDLARYIKPAEDNAARILRETSDNNVKPEDPEHPDPRPEKECSYKEFANTKPTIYYGTGGPVATMDWISNIEVCFETCQCQPYLKVRYATTLLQRAALHWWNGVRFTYGISQVVELLWDEFKVLIQENYFPRSETLKLEIEFLRLEMGNESIQEYTEKFVEKVRFAPFLAANESRKIELYTEGLRPDLKKKSCK